MVSRIALYHRVHDGILHTRVIGSNEVCVGTHTGAALVAVDKTELIVLGVGAAAEEEAGENTLLYAPFSHPRLAVHEFDVAVKLLRWFADFAMKDASVPLRLLRHLPTPMIVHIQRRWDDSLTDIEKRALLDLARASGASQAYICGHSEALTDEAVWESCRGRGEKEGQTTV